MVLHTKFDGEFFMKKKSQNLLDKIKREFNQKSKVETLEFAVNGEMLALFYIESLIDKKLMASSIIEPVQRFLKTVNSNKDANISVDEFIQDVFSVSSVQKLNGSAETVAAILDGKVVCVFKDEALEIPIFGAQKRGIEEPPTSRVVKGPREGFVEDAATNLGLIRKRLRTTNLQIEEVFVGKQTHTQVSMIYLKNISRPEIVKTVKKKLESIDIDAIIDSYYIESFLEDNKVKFFRRVGNTEKPDIFCAKILEGRVGLIVDS